METNNISFWNLIHSYKISIPIIQRDYAQGREEEDEKREKFLNSLLKHINGAEKLHLDFVYGRVNENTFYPIDGQQRLTTLFLLHWYFAIKENVETADKAQLSQFVYDTRISSREFCQYLIKEKIELPISAEKDAFIAEIKNKHWYRNKWDTDPTVKAMLIMIQAIHYKFYTINSGSVFRQLTNDKLISFELLDLGAKGFELSDELYIKMNARGKQLTPFENFKANFIQLIDKHFKDKKMQHPIKGELAYSGYFSYKIEKEWTDLFWSFRGNKKTVDEGFSNYFEFITQLLFFKENRNLNAEDFKNTFSQYEGVYKIEENILFLFSSLDILYKIYTKNGLNGDKVNIENFYKNLFYIDNQVLEPNSKIRLFWSSSEDINLFEIIIKNNEAEDISNKRRTWILQFCILQHIVRFDKYEVDEELNNYVRIIRNLFQMRRQKRDTKYNNDVRINYFGDYFPVFDKLNSNDVYNTLKNEDILKKGARFSESAIKYEIEKAKILLSNEAPINKALLAIENIEDFGGLIHQLKPQENIAKFPEYLSAITEIWGAKIADTLRIQALIACGFTGVYIKWTKMGGTYYFGKKSNWAAVLTNEEANVSNSILGLLDAYTHISAEITEPGKKLQAIIDKWLIENKTDRSYKYYFLKYSEFTSRLNYYVRNDYEIRMLGTDTSNPLLAYHISPYVFTVCKKINDMSICDSRDCYFQYSGHSPLFLKKGISMYSTNEGWKIPVNPLITAANITKYSLVLVDDKHYLLKENEERDRVEIAVDFIKDIV